eukprot:812179-Pyramimonas_sp.AAC.1
MWPTPPSADGDVGQESLARLFLQPPQDDDKGGAGASSSGCLASPADGSGGARDGVSDPRQCEETRCALRDHLEAHAGH